MVQEAPLIAPALEHAERVQAELQNTPSGRQVRIVLERHDEKLGWYTSGGLTLPLHQLPLLEQAIADMRHTPSEPEFADIIPFPAGEAAA
jgi:hypothetical protein